MREISVFVQLLSFTNFYGDEVEFLRNEMFFYFFSEQIFETHDDDDLVYPVLSLIHI